MVFKFDISAEWNGSTNEEGNPFSRALELEYTEAIDRFSQTRKVSFILCSVTLWSFVLLF